MIYRYLLKRLLEFHCEKHELVCSCVKITYVLFLTYFFKGIFIAILSKPSKGSFFSKLFISAHLFFTWAACTQ